MGKYVELLKKLAFVLAFFKMIMNGIYVYVKQVVYKQVVNCAISLQ